MLSRTNDILLRELTLGMAFELLIVIALIVLFIVSLCSLLQKIRKAYDHENDSRRVTVSQVYSLEVPPSYESQSENSPGVYPGGIAPPAYSEHYEPPPKYDDVIKSCDIVMLPPVPVHQPPQQRQSQNMTTVVAH